MTSPLGRRGVWALPSAWPAPPAAAPAAKGSREGPATRDSPPSPLTPPPTSPARGAGPLRPLWAPPQAPLSPSTLAPAPGPSLLPADPQPTPLHQVLRWPHRALGMDQKEPTRQTPAHPWLRRKGSCPTCRGTSQALSLLLLSQDLPCPPTPHLGAHCILGWVPTPRAALLVLMDLKDHSMETKVTTLGPPTTVGLPVPATAAPALA